LQPVSRGVAVVPIGHCHVSGPVHEGSVAGPLGSQQIGPVPVQLGVHVTAVPLGHFHLPSTHSIGDVVSPPQ
jgi:hypothetical protein